MVVSLPDPADAHIFVSTLLEQPAHGDHQRKQLLMGHGLWLTQRCYNLHHHARRALDLQPDPHSLISAPMNGVMGKVEEVRGLVFYLLPCSECLYCKALARLLGGGRCQPSRLLPAPSFRVASFPRHDAGEVTRVRTRVNRRSYMQRGGRKLYGPCWGGPPSITWGVGPSALPSFA